MADEEQRIEDFAMTLSRPGIPRQIQEDLERKFNRLADQWHKDTRLMSSITKMAIHPAYQQIIGMGPVALPWILRDLQITHDHWLWALYSIVGHDPSPEGANFDEAVRSWLAWGKENKYL